VVIRSRRRDFSRGVRKVAELIEKHRSVPFDSLRTVIFQPIFQLIMKPQPIPHYLGKACYELAAAHHEIEIAKRRMQLIAICQQKLISGSKENEVHAWLRQRLHEVRMNQFSATPARATRAKS
jgi:hypothetical protein